MPDDPREKSDPAATMMETVRAMKKIARYPETGDVVVQFLTGEGGDFILSLAPGMLGPLIVGLLQVQREIGAPTPGEYKAQPLMLETSNPVTLGSGNVGLLLHFANGLELTIMFPNESLQTAISGLQKLKAQALRERRATCRH
jgi:hypothetical protein